MNILIYGANGWIGKQFISVIDEYPLESYVTHVSHRSLQGAPENPSEKMTKGHFPYRIRKDMLE